MTAVWVILCVLAIIVAFVIGLVIAAILADHELNSAAVTVSGCWLPLAGIQVGTSGSRTLVCPVCPDLLDYEAIGEADSWRGRVVRAFFWCIRWWKP